MRRAGIPVKSQKPDMKKMSKDSKKETMKIVNSYTGPVFSDKIGKIMMEPVRLQYEPGFKAMYGLPYHYQDRLATHLHKLTFEGIIEEVDPSEPVDVVLNLAISEKKTARGTLKNAGPIRMNIDARPLNIGAKQTKYHVITPQEIRHKLEGAAIFTEADMGNGFHQVPLHTDSQCVFQSHLGLHRMKNCTLDLRAVPASSITRYRKPFQESTAVSLSTTTSWFMARTLKSTT